MTAVFIYTCDYWTLTVERLADNVEQQDVEIRAIKTAKGSWGQGRIFIPTNIDSLVKESWLLGQFSFYMTISSVNQFFVIYILFIMEIFDIINIGENGKSALIISLKDYDYGQEYCLYIESQI